MVNKLVSKVNYFQVMCTILTEWICTKSKLCLVLFREPHCRVEKLCLRLEIWGTQWDSKLPIMVCLSSLLIQSSLGTPYFKPGPKTKTSSVDNCKYWYEPVNYIYISMVWIYAYIVIHRYISVYICVCVCVYIKSCLSKCIQVGMYMSVCVYIYICHEKYKDILSDRIMKNMTWKPKI